tara:strand:+ start:462 stop:845 length:384 start_codon:yes stop_codon:yes gene_type:complete
MFKNKNHKDKLINISELIKIINLRNDDGKNIKAHTLRFWEKKFTQIKPQILSGKRRYYSKKQVDLFILITHLLKDKGLTITGAKKILNKKWKNLDVTELNSINTNNFKTILTNKSKNILNKLKKLKK